MAIKCLMSYVKSQKRWVKKYKGQCYFVSCKQLGVPGTKEASWLAANEWWTARQKEIESQEEANLPQHSPSALGVIDLAKANTLSDLHALVERGNAALRLIEILEQIGVEGANLEDVREALVQLQAEDSDLIDEALMRATLIASIDEDWTYRCKETADLCADSLTLRAKSLEALNKLKSDLTSQIPSERAVTHWVDQWLSHLDAKVSGGRLSLARKKAYAVEIGRFKKWFGEKSIEDIVEATLTGFYSHLAEQIRDSCISASTATNTFMTFRQFVRFLGEHRLIPLPLNMGSRHFQFGNGPASIETFTVDEVRSLLSESSDRAKLYYLLMLNCGMYQGDISDLLVQEVDWKAGTITRKRSKRKKARKALEVCYKLWPETLRLLREFRTKPKRADGRVLQTEDGKPLVSIEPRYDTVQSCFYRLSKRLGITKPLKALRKTSATMLGKHKEYKFYAQYFLAQAPTEIVEKHYVVPSQEEFFAALDWLREQLLG